MNTGARVTPATTPRRSPTPVKKNSPTRSKAFSVGETLLFIIHGETESIPSHNVPKKESSIKSSGNSARPSTTASRKESEHLKEGTTGQKEVVKLTETERKEAIKERAMEESELSQKEEDKTNEYEAEPGAIQEKEKSKEELSSSLNHQDSKMDENEEENTGTKGKEEEIDESFDPNDL